MHVTPDAVAAERDWLLDRTEIVVPLVNQVRTDLAGLFDAEVEPVEESAYRQEVRAVFADGDLAVNVAALVAILRDLDVAGDYPGFVVDELLGRQLAGTIAGGQPLGLLAEATFHYADAMVHGEAGATAGADDLDAALAAGFQTRLPGWPWRESASPFSVAAEDG